MTVMTFDAKVLSRAWLAVAQASGTDKAGNSAFYRAVQVEFFPEGVRLVATDLTVLLHAWVPQMGDEDLAGPGLDETPKSIVVGLDLDQRGLGLMRYARSIAGGEDALPVEVLVSIEREVDEKPQGRLDLDPDGPELLVFDLPGLERVRVGLYGAEWPDWRSLWDSFKPKQTRALALNPTLIARLAKLGDFAEGPLIWHFGGVDKTPSRVTIGVPPVVVQGLVMPWRWEPRMDALEPEEPEPTE